MLEQAAFSVWAARVGRTEVERLRIGVSSRSTQDVDLDVAPLYNWSFLFPMYMNE